MAIFAASIMCANQLELKTELDRLKEARIDMLHCDVMDGAFVSNLGMGPYVLEQIAQYSKLPMDIHLATLNPENYAKLFLKLRPEIISFHIETVENPHKTIEFIKENGIKASVAVSPDTPICAVEPVIREVDMVLIMAVNPGFAGQKIKPQTPKRIRQLKSLCEKYDVHPLIEVDGNINEETIPEVVNEGANVLVLGTSSIFKKDNHDYSISIARLRALC
ncbi:ribulose-phosphate 3-epimerase [Thermoanaerobacterium sp. DL9XJH110]|uniref:ribulose-phosphate 3-epimerase n=1 Tax=Thermoanaerobacterium sp. DL9XJH110 TaxID=3386643 RepID=UPI003BB80AED